jgi:hypothetical protein
MEQFIMLMWLCSTVNSPPCFQITTPEKVFDDHYSCVSFGYSHSVELIGTKFKKEEINRLGLYTRFACKKQTLPKKETNA